jgi:glucose-6-phosphate isomerase
MAPLSLDLTYIKQFVPDAELKKMAPEASKALDALLSKSGRGNDFLGWISLPSDVVSQLPAVKAVAKKLQISCTDVVCIGIGGSYLGTRAALEALGSPKAKVHYAGHHLSPTALTSLMKSLNPKKTGIVIISKSGTTTEPAVAFRLFRAWLEKAVGRTGAAKRIVAVTDKAKGALKGMADAEGWPTFVIPDDVGGRFSVLTPVGLIPLAAAGVDVTALVKGAQDAAKVCSKKDFKTNPALQYAAIRNALYRKHKSVEVLANYKPELHFVAEWWKQLYGESEGKEGKGLFPASVDLTSDLHSMGQYMQEGQRLMMETVLWVKQEAADIILTKDAKDLDGLNFLSGKKLSWVNEQAMRGTAVAHADGGVPVLRLNLEKLDAYHLGYLFYFFELACGISGYMLGVNPFDQPGVEAYKKNMFALLGKKGYEKLASELKAKGV